MCESTTGDTIRSGDARSIATGMGPLELAVYKADWMVSRRYLRHVADVAMQRELEAAAKAAQDEILKTAGKRFDRAAAADQAAHKPKSGFAALRRAVPDMDDDEERDIDAPTPGRIAARLLLARLFDAAPGSIASLRAGSPVITVDVPDAAIFSRVSHQWKSALALESLASVDLAQLSDRAKREDYDLIYLATGDTLSAKEAPVAEARAFNAIQLALPVLAFSPGARTHLSKALLDAATHSLTLPTIDATVIARVIRIVTGRPFRSVLPQRVVADTGIHELILSVRFDRSPEECVAHLVRLAEAKDSRRGSRDLSLDELHGIDEGVAWARATILDIEAWRRGEIAWDAIDAGMVLNGPPGTGKTTFAKVFAAESGLPLISATLAKWQGSGEGHLGHLLRAMRRDFDEARSKSPAIMFVDELDSFPNRAGVLHSHRDYVVEVVNGFIESLDGVAGRQGLIFIGATNDVLRCDPAIVRAGRLNCIIQVRLPRAEDLEKMMRVRLRGRLADQPIDQVALLAVGSSGADVERIVKDAARAARHAERQLTVDDLRRAVTGEDDIRDDILDRVSVHEAGHIVVHVVHNGPAAVRAVIGGTTEKAGFVAWQAPAASAGTAAECRRTLQGLLAGRAAEEIELGAGGNGAGGSAQSDLGQATRLAAAMVGSYGHSGPHPLLYVGDHRQTGEILDHAYLRTAAHEELSAAYGEARRILQERRVALREVARRLRIHRRIDGSEVAEILEKFARSQASSELARPDGSEQMRPA
jgi:AAA+ superfamily predicted ATPase